MAAHAKDHCVGGPTAVLPIDIGCPVAVPHAACALDSYLINTASAVKRTENRIGKRLTWPGMKRFVRVSQLDGTMPTNAGLLINRQCRPPLDGRRLTD